MKERAKGSSPLGTNQSGVPFKDYLAKGNAEGMHLLNSKLALHMVLILLGEKPPPRNFQMWSSRTQWAGFYTNLNFLANSKSTEWNNEIRESVEQSAGNREPLQSRVEQQTETEHHTHRYGDIYGERVIVRAPQRTVKVERGVREKHCEP